MILLLNFLSGILLDKKDIVQWVQVFLREVNYYDNFNLTSSRSNFSLFHK